MSAAVASGTDDFPAVATVGGFDSTPTRPDSRWASAARGPRNPRELDDQGSCVRSGALGELAQRGFDLPEVGEAMQALGGDAELAAFADRAASARRAAPRRARHAQDAPRLCA